MKNWEDMEWRFKRSLKTLQVREILSQVPKQVWRKKTFKKTKKKEKNTLKVEAMRPGVRSSVQKIIFTFLVITRGARARLEKCFFSASLGKKPSFSTQT
jgi:hypothetical protein